MKNNKPLVSVVMTAFNAAGFIDAAVESVMNQTYSNMEILIVDDCSTDTTWKKIKAFKRKDHRIQAFRLDKNTGPSGASNIAMQKIKGAYIARMDADDVAYPDRIEKQVAYMEKNKKTAVIGGQCDIIDESDKVIGKKSFPTDNNSIRNALFIINPIQHPACMYRTSVYKKAQITYEKQYFISHDLKILFELLPYGTFANLPDTILKYRYRPTSITHANPKRTFKETVDIRHWALKTGAYNPTAFQMAMHLAQFIVVTVLPNKVINLLFQAWRVHKTIEENPITVQLKSWYRFTMQSFLTI